MKQDVNILIADGNNEIATQLSTFLSNQKEFVVQGIVDNGVDAIDRIANEKPDIVILEMLLPKIDGIGVLKAIQSKKIEKRPVFLVLSSLSQEVMIR